MSNFLGDRVQWFRAEAEMQRWQEEWEKTIAEFMRTIHHFESMHNAWLTLAQLDSHTAGARAYSHKKAAMYDRFHLEAQKIFTRAKTEGLLGLKDTEKLVDYIKREREELSNTLLPLLPATYIVCSCFLFFLWSDNLSWIQGSG